MPEYRISIKTDNDAFSPDPCPELARILRHLAAHLETHGTGSPGDRINLRDANGNKVGAANWK